jgi:hypothetical protein
MLLVPDNLIKQITLSYKINLFIKKNIVPHIRSILEQIQHPTKYDELSVNYFPPYKIINLKKSYPMNEFETQSKSKPFFLFEFTTPVHVTDFRFSPIPFKKANVAQFVTHFYFRKLLVFSPPTYLINYTDSATNQFALQQPVFCPKINISSLANNGDGNHLILPHISFYGRQLFGNSYCDRKKTLFERVAVKNYRKNISQN